MIETIFYFANSKAEYDSNANSGNISARTISFVPTGNGVGDIYKNGIKYGSSIDEDELIRIINKRIADINSNIPFASTSKAGIVKLGKGLKAVSNDGTVNVDFTGLNGIDGLDGLVENILKTIIGKNGTGVVVTPRSLSGSTVAIADIKVGDTTKTIYAPVGSNNQNDPTNTGKTEVSVVPLFNSSTGTTKIATITVDGNTKELWIPAGTGGGDNPGGGGSEPYDDTDIKNAIRDLQNRADATESDLRDLLDETEAEVREKFKNAFNTYEDLIDYYKQSGDTTPTKFTFGKEDADEWASQMGLITPNGDGTYNVGWSTLTQSYNSLAGEVAQIKANQSVGGEIDYEALQAGLYSYIDLNAATSGMDSTWGKFVKKDDDEIQMLEWMQAAIKTYASNQEAYARLLAAAKDYDENGDTIQEGIAKIDAFVEKDSNGNYVAGTSLASLVDGSLSEIFTENSSNNAVAGLYARLSDVEDTADDDHDAISGLQSKVEEIDGKIYAEADLVSAITNKKDEIVSSAGLATKASLEEAKSSLSSQIGTVSASIETCVKKDSNGVIESGVTLNADKINIDSGHQLNLTSPHVNLDADRINMSGLITAINGDDSSVVIDADKINVGGICIEDLNISGINSLTSNEIWTNAIKSSVGDITISADNIILDGTTFVEDLFANLMAVAKKVSVGEGDGAIRIYDTGLGYAGLVCGNTSSEYITIDSSTGGWNMVLYDTSEAAKLSRNGLYFYSGSGGTSSSNTTLCINAETPEIRLYDGTLSSYSNQMIISPTGTSTSSDMRLKDVIADKLLTAEQIADAPIFTYTPKANPNANPIIGTSAQYWQDITPEAVSELDGYLALDYSKVATTSVINLAKEVVTLKEENTTLKQRVEALEARLQLIENKLNAQ